MICSPILALLALCTMTPEPPPVALPLAEERPTAMACMTKEQARATFRTSHLYWHTTRHCWDDRPVGSRRYAAAPKPRSNPVNLSAAPITRSQPRVLSVADANANEGREARIEIYYPALMREQAAVAADMYSMQRPITEWPLMLDLDATGPDPDHGIDGCCWPPLEQMR